jgi:hypothetical protein
MVIGSAFGKITARLLCPASSSFTTGAELKHFAKAGLSLNYPADVNLEDTDTEKGKKNVSREERYLTDGCDPNSVVGRGRLSLLLVGLDEMGHYFAATLNAGIRCRLSGRRSYGVGHGSHYRITSQFI